MQGWDTALDGIEHTFASQRPEWRPRRTGHCLSWASEGWLLCLERCPQSGLALVVYTAPGHTPTIYRTLSLDELVRKAEDLVLRFALYVQEAHGN